MPNSRLLSKIQGIATRAGFSEFAVSFFDYETNFAFSFRGDRPFHAASTIKAAILLAFFRGVETGVCRLDDPLHVRNCFSSAAGGHPFRVDGESDGDPSVHKRIGRTMFVSDLARAMIIRSSNLATNLLFELLGAEFIAKTLAEAGLEGIHAVRGVEDAAAHEEGIDNEITADALVRLFRDFQERKHLHPENAERALQIFLEQEFNAMIPGRLPEGTKVAHKTGEISTCAHDAGIVFPAGRQPYVLAILTEMPPETKSRNRHIAGISRVVYDYLTQDNG